MKFVNINEGLGRGAVKCKYLKVIIVKENHGLLLVQETKLVTLKAS